MAHQFRLLQIYLLWILSLRTDGHSYEQLLVLCIFQYQNCVNWNLWTADK